ncbi:branched-chain amino acid ABC transporter substrate-binding protein [Desulfococcus multivorans]|uniref:Extracellular ligand-binding receptor n=2 Tax=Desulfococcus multivorans TaxID=897 RepID=S7TZ59_DESML|nr:branched-chain amino acid ABC transporter substrate-binding protein [Desulfococcus multivorans]AOY57397.1 livK1: high-affinity branched-chain amino acid transport system periplasmatic protein [Desulfococcus multivorans]AQU99839.1 branched chain amino acid ABC transporter substrate-binding protein [Desulfococcus multivorans]EPR42025.1 extracellular ligand-binding receptor [Desulfococcus multivorans DSM 2059]CAJ13751.1 ABC-type branched-chain amino acid transport systems, periplasmic component
MKKKLLKALVWGCVLVPFILSGAAAKTLKIGSMSPLTGPYASDGTDIKNGVLTAIEVFEKEGGIPGYDKIELFAQDTACDPKQAVAAANKLINLEVVGVIGAYCSSSTIPASETLAEEDIPMLTPASTNEMVTDRGLPYMFRLCGRDDDQAPASAKFMKESLGAKTIFIIDDKTTYSQGLADGIEKACTDVGIEVLGHDHVNQGDKDFSAVLTKAKDINADIVYMSLQGYSPGALMAIQAKRMGVSSTLVTQDAMFQPKFMEVAKEAAEGIYLTYGYTDPNTPEYKAFENIYVPKYGPIAAYATYAYDAATVLLKAIKAAGSTDPAKLKAEIMKMDFNGASKRIKFRENGDSGSTYIAFKIENGKFVPYWDPQKGLLK